MRVGQIWQWIYHWGVRDFAAMTNLAKDYRALLAERFEIALPEVVTRQISRRWHPQISAAHRRRA
jgi:23S rRNA (adenine2503-C2)-methyltransferase